MLARGPLRRWLLGALAASGWAQQRPRRATPARVGALAVGAFLCCCFCWGSAVPALAGTAGKVVRYRGYKVVVPASWPVYDLRADPDVCVRFNRHAVYLGRPSSAQHCPAHAVGRTEAILLEPLAARGARASASAGAALAAVGTREAQPPAGSSAQLVVPRAGVLVTATWGSDPAAMERILSRPLARPNRASEARPPRGQAPQARAASAAGGGVYTGLGFDACSAPSAGSMSAWSKSPYRALGVYIGGTNMACSQPNLTAAWVSSETAAGWHLVPTYVGLQAPSNSCGCAAINPSRASAEGTAAAHDAVSRAGALGIGTGSPIYYDMEGYARGGTNTSAVLAFLGAWTSTLHAAGYESGVYSNADSGISDLVAARTSGYEEPDDIWIAEWNGEHNTATPYVPSGEWSEHERLHQYSGAHNATYGGATINIDGDYLDGATAGTSAPTSEPGNAFAAASIPNGTYVQVAGSSGLVYEIAGGAALFVSPQYWASISSVQPTTTISPEQYTELNSVPAEGTLLETASHALYRVAGGAPLPVEEPHLFVGLPSVTIDPWDIENVGNPAVHLNTVPTNGTFLTTTTGSVYRIAGGAPFAIANWSLFGGIRASVTIDPWDLENISSPDTHLDAKPSNGTVVEGLPSRSYWVFSEGTRRLSSPSGAAVQVEDAALVALPALPCVVPRLGRLTLPQAKRALQRGDCRLGGVTRPARSRPRHTPLRVIKQIPQAHSTQTAGYAVGIGLG